MTTDSDIAAIETTREVVFSAYRAGDVDTMMAHFHPDVIQIPEFDKILDGKAAVEANYAAALSRFEINITDTLENLSIGGDLATTHGTYAITLTPREGGGAPMRRSGRYMVIMKRWAESPTGWSTFRELVQPEP